MAWRTCKAVCHVHSALGDLAQQDAHDALLGVPSDAVVVVHDAEQHQRVQHHLVRRGRHGAAETPLIGAVR